MLSEKGCKSTAESTFLDPIQFSGEHSEIQFGKDEMHQR